MDGIGFWLAAVLASALVGMSKGGVPVVGMLGVPVMALVMNPVMAAGLLLQSLEAKGLWFLLGKSTQALLAGEDGRVAAVNGVSLPRLCCASIRFSPPPSRAWARLSSSRSRMSFMPAPPARSRERPA